MKKIFFVIILIVMIAAFIGSMVLAVVNLTTGGIDALFMLPILLAVVFFIRFIVVGSRKGYITILKELAMELDATLTEEKNLYLKGSYVDRDYKILCGSNFLDSEIILNKPFSQTFEVDRGAAGKKYDYSTKEELFIQALLTPEVKPLIQSKSRGYHKLLITPSTQGLRVVMTFNSSLALNRDFTNQAVRMFLLISHQIYLTASSDNLKKTALVTLLSQPKRNELKQFIITFHGTPDFPELVNSVHDSNVPEDNKLLFSLILEEPGPTSARIKKLSLAGKVDYLELIEKIGGNERGYTELFKVTRDFSTRLKILECLKQRHGSSIQSFLIDEIALFSPKFTGVHRKLIEMLGELGDKQGLRFLSSYIEQNKDMPELYFDACKKATQEMVARCGSDEYDGRLSFSEDHETGKMSII